VTARIGLVSAIFGALPVGGAVARVGGPRRGWSTGIKLPSRHARLPVVRRVSRVLHYLTVRGRKAAVHRLARQPCRATTSSTRETVGDGKQADLPESPEHLRWVMTPRRSSRKAASGTASRGEGLLLNAGTRSRGRMARSACRKS